MSDVLKVNMNFLTNFESGLGTTQQKPKFPQYALANKRKDSYKTWPAYLPSQPDVLVDAGLVYTGVGDSVRCFYCGGGLRNWERDDNPWEEHAKWYPTCPYVLQVKGQEYVERVKRGEKPAMDGPRSEAVEPPPPERDLLDTVAARACIDMGYKEDMVRKAIDIYLNKSGGKINFKGADLCEILIELEESEKETNASTGWNVADLRRKQTSTDVKANMEEDDHESVEKLEEENRRLKENMVCKICLDDPASVSCLPFVHMVSLPQCAPALNNWSIYWIAIKDTVKAYFATN